MTNLLTQIPTLELTITTEFGDITTVKTTLTSTEIEYIMAALQCCLMGCGYAESTVREWFEETK